MEELLSTFAALAEEIVWCTVATVDRRNRPRSRILHPVWQRDGDRLVGWIATRPTPLKRAHLEHSAHVSCSYWRESHDTAVAECRADWVDSPLERARIWELIAATPPPVGYDPATIWRAGPAAPDFAVIRLEPWRIRVASGADVLAGRPPRSWRAGQRGPRTSIPSAAAAAASRAS